jgi:phosphate transport system permease protein
VDLTSRKLVDRSFTGLGLFSILLMTAALVILLAPIVVRGLGAFVFKGTVEHRKLQFEVFGHGKAEAIDEEVAEVAAARQPVYDMLAAFEAELESADFATRRKHAGPLHELKDHLRKLLGPLPGEDTRVLMREQYGQARWDRAQIALNHLLLIETYDYSDPTRMGRKILVPRAEDFKGTSLEPLFAYVEDNASAMLKPRWTLYWQFLFDSSHDAHFFGGIWPELLGTIYLTIGAILFAVPLGVISAIYLVEYADEGSRIVGLLRTCIGTLAGVPSIVFGLFGLAFFINSLHVSQSKSVLAGALTLGILILPFVIRSSEEAIRAVPHTYKQAALSLGAGKWRTITTVILPVALPGILTGTVISMGRAAGETAPIIFTAAVSVGRPLSLWQTFSEPTPALPWNIYNLCSEHEAVDEIRHVQYGMVFTLVMLVLLLNSGAILLRARIARRMRG